MGFPQFEKKGIKFTLVLSNGAHKIVPKSKKHYHSTVSPAILMSQLPFSSSFVSVFRFCTFLSYFWVILFHPCIYNDNSKKRESYRLQTTTAIMLGDKRPGFCCFLSPGLPSHSECSKMAPFLEKGPLKLCSSRKYPYSPHGRFFVLHPGTPPPQEIPV